MYTITSHIFGVQILFLHLQLVSQEAHSFDYNALSKADCGINLATNNLFFDLLKTE
jgi:hypothetical protein